jgi:dehydrogenase/reductase SDR family member 7B
LNSLPAKVEEILSIFGHIDILINNGGISVRADVLSTTMDVDIKVMLVNYFGSVAMTKGVEFLLIFLNKLRAIIICFTL